MVISRLPSAKHTEHLTLSSCLELGEDSENRPASQGTPGSSGGVGGGSKEVELAGGPGAVTPQTWA